MIDPAIAADLIDCDSCCSRRTRCRPAGLFNAIVYQYRSPGVQVGAKIQLDKDDGQVLDIFCVIRPMLPGQGRLWCIALISPSSLQEEATDTEQLCKQRYVDDEDVPAPSVITLNAVAAAGAVDFYLSTSRDRKNGSRCDGLLMIHAVVKSPTTFPVATTHAVNASVDLAPDRSCGCRPTWPSFKSSRAAPNNV